MVVIEKFIILRNWFYYFYGVRVGFLYCFFGGFIGFFDSLRVVDWFKRDRVESRFF